MIVPTLAAISSEKTSLLQLYCDRQNFIQRILDRWKIFSNLLSDFSQILFSHHLFDDKCPHFIKPRNGCLGFSLAFVPQRLSGSNSLLLRSAFGPAGRLRSQGCLGCILWCTFFYFKFPK